MTKFLFSDRLIGRMEKLQESTMDYTCSIERPGSQTTDGWNQDVPGSYSILPDRQPCSFKASPAGGMTDNGYQENLSRMAEYVEIVPKVKMPLGTDVRLTDRLVDIQDRHGNAVQPYRFEIKSIAPRLGNLVLYLQAVQ